MSIWNRDQSSRKARLSELENTIEAARVHMRQVAHAGEALDAIRTEKLYMLEFTSFENYVTERWGMTRQHAYDLMGAASVLKALCDAKQQPQSIRQAKALAALPADEVVDAWDEIMEDAPTGENGEKEITAAAVHAVAAKRKPKRKKKAAPKPQRLRVPGATVIIERNKTGADFEAERILADALAKLRGEISPDLAAAEQRKAA